MRLVRCGPRGPRRHPIPVLIGSPLLAKPYVPDLAPRLSLVDHLVERGLELFLLDFGIPDSQDRQLRFEDHLGVVDLAMNELLAQTGVKRATLLGYCLGGIFATVYAATHPDSVQNLVALATPVDFSRGGRCTDMSARNLRIWRNSCFVHGTRATWSASDWSAAGSTTSCRFRGGVPPVRQGTGAGQQARAR